MTTNKAIATLARLFADHLGKGLNTFDTRDTDEQRETLERIAREFEGETWTTELPTVSGWYWWRNPYGHGWEVVLVNTDMRMYLCGTTNSRELPSGCEWSGPLSPPPRETEPR